MGVFRQAPTVACPQVQVEAPRQDRMAACLPGREEDCRLAPEAVFRPDPEEGFPPDPVAVCLQDPVAGYQQDRAAGCQRDQRRTIAAFHLGLFSLGSLGNAVFANTQT